MISLEHIQKYYKEYKATNVKDDKAHQVVLDAIKSNHDEKNCHHQFSLWMVVFQADKKITRKMILLKNELQAIKCLSDNIKKPHPILLESSAALARLMIEDSEDYSWDKEKEAVWLKVFTDMPEFKIQLEKEHQYWINWRGDLFAKHPQTVIEKPVIETFSVQMPMVFRVQSGWDLPIETLDPNPFEFMVEEIMNNFNSFHLEGYIEMDFINSIILRVNTSNEFPLWVFDVACNQSVNSEDKEKFLEELKGQLSDGWGEGIEQKWALVDKYEYNLHFDYEKAVLLQDKPVTTKKLTK